MHEDLSSPLQAGWWPDPGSDDAHALPALELARDRVERVALLAMQSSPAPLPGAEPAGGTSVYVASVAAALARIGVACDIYTRASSPDQPLLRELWPGVRLLSVPVGPRLPLDRARLVPLVEPFAAGVAGLGEALGPYQLLSTHWWLSGLAGLRLRERWGVPVEFRPHSLALERNQALGRGHLLRSPERAQGEARVIALADLLVAGSRSEQADLTGRYGAAADSVRLLPCGVDAELFCPGDRQRARDHLGLDLKGRHLLAYVGRLDPVKGVDLAVDALVALGEGWPDLDAELLVVGGSPRPPRYRQQVAELRNTVNWHAAAGRVHFLPARPHQALPLVYQAADLLLMPSRAETFGLVALEAQACGVPVVASRAGSLPEVVSHGITGVLVAERDPCAWARAVAALLSSPAWLHAMRAAAVAQATRFSWHATATGLLAAYYETVASFSRPASSRATARCR
jgi:D-inositol-3-phosphate glycosyltransferase